jgi:WD40 repeat protein
MKPKQNKVINLDRQLCFLRYSNDGKFLAGACQDATVRRLDAATPDLKPLDPLRGHSGWVTTLAFHPDGKRLLSADSWGRLTCWDFADAKSLWSVEKAHDGWLRSLSVSADGNHVATGGDDGKVRLWSCADGKSVRDFAGHTEEVHSVAIHPDGKSLVSGDRKAVVRQWDLATGKVTREFDAKTMYVVFGLQELGGARFMTFDAKGTTLAVCGAIAGTTRLAGAGLMLFDWATGKAKHTVKLGSSAHDGYVCDMVFHPDGFLMTAISGTPGQGRLQITKPGESAAVFTLAMLNPQCLAVAPDFKRFVVSTTNAGSNGNGRVLKGKEYPVNYSPLHVFDV